MGHRLGHPSVIRAAGLITAIGLLGLTSFAQQPKVLAPHRPIPQRIPKSQEQPLAPAKQDSLAGGLWMTDPNVKSSLYLKNVVEVSAITVTPILYLSNGNKFTLPDVTLEPSGTAVVDINAALQNLGIASYATLSGYVEIQYTWPWVPVCATIRVVDIVHSLIFTYGVRPPATPGQNSVGQGQVTTVAEAVWWRQESNLAGFVALANTTSSPVPAVIGVTDNQGTALATHAITISPHGTKIVVLPELQSAAITEGGIRVIYGGPAGALDVNGGLQDQNVGYSANLRFTPAPPASAKASQMSIAELGLMVGAADPMMLFPAGTTFTPYSVLRNISDAPMTVTPTLWWMAAGSARSAVFPSLALRPGRSQSLNLMSLISAAGLKNFSGSVNLAFDVQGKESGLLLAAGSVDQSGTYVFEVVPRGIQEGASKSVGYWSTANGDDTMVTIWNPADEAQDFVFRLIFSGGHYSLSIPLGPRATRSFNISEIIQNQVPDAEGNIIPASVHEGSATIAGVHADVEHILVAVDAGIYNVRKATCGTTCVYCDGYTSFSMVPGSAVFAVQHTQQYQFIGIYSSGTQYNVANGWSSSNTPVATVISSGVATGVSLGSANFITSFSQPVYEGEVCYGGSFECPTASGSPQGSGTIATIPVNFRQTSVSQLSGGVLKFTYAWDSSSGQLTDLSNCTVGEIVSYPGSGATYYWSSPPYASGSSNPNPTTTSFSATSGSGTDQHGHPNFLKPYTSNSFNATQNYRFQCSNYQNGAWQTMMGPLTISRTVSQNSDGTWKYVITKSGSSNQISPLP